jgi:tRNA wybutosine-synthesizing protein 3
MKSSTTTTSTTTTDNTPNMRLEDLEQDYVDDKREWLPSFADIKIKTQQTLYEGLSVSSFRDKSPKGSVDERIRPLVDLINQHDAFSTLSSCSGRISLFDPNSKESDEEETRGENPRSGKGVGGWLLVSHEEIHADQLTSLFFMDTSCAGESNSVPVTTDQDPLMFKVEPLLLHVAAASLKRGRQMLAIALALGFRESGLVVSDSRVTVHVRGQSLALCVPLTKSGSLCPSKAYLQSLVDQANMRMRQNLEKLNRLYDSVFQSLFRPPEESEPRCAISVSADLPDLNLFGFAAVAFAESDGNVNIYAFGGYGQGPFLAKSNARSNQIYVLKYRNQEGFCGSEWRAVDVVNDETSSKASIWSGLPVSMATFPACQSVQACILSKCATIMIFGGRKSPSNPLGTVFFFDPGNMILGSPSNIRGKPPSPRWGHTLTSFSEDSAVVVGGCTSEGPVDADLHIFSIVRDSADPHFRWETIQTDLIPRFHHTTIIERTQIFVFGGMGTTSNVVDQGVPSWRGELFLANESWSLKDSDIIEFDTPLGFGLTAFGIIPSKSSSRDQTFVLLAGGVHTPQHYGAPPAPIQCYSINRYQVMNEIPTQIAFENNEKRLDFGSMVHHQCVPLGHSEFLLLGGGVSSFAFGYSFAK